MPAMDDEKNGDREANQLIPHPIHVLEQQSSCWPEICCPGGPMCVIGYVTLISALCGTDTGVGTTLPYLTFKQREEDHSSFLTTLCQ